MNEVLRIGAIEVDPPALEVRGPAGLHRLEPRAAAVLERLAQEPGRVVTREELIQSVWGHPHVSKDTLAVTVHRLRQALNEAGGPGNGEGPVETVPRRGYRLRLPGKPVARGLHPGRRGWLVAGASVAATLLVVALLVPRDGPAPAPDGPEATLDRAVALWDRREPAAARRAVALARAVLEQVPEASGPATRAHALLGRFYGYKTAHWLGLERSEAAALGRRHLDRVLASDPRDPEVLASAASFALYTERDPARAHRLAREAVARDPDGLAPRQALARAAAATGDAETALATIRALAADAPADGGVQWDRAFLLFLAGKHEASLKALEAAVSLSDRDPYWLAAFNRHAMGEHGAAAATWADHLRRKGCPVSLAADVATAFRELLEADGRCGGGFDYHRGLWAFYAGDLGEARRYFEAALADDDYMYIWSALNPLPHEASALAGSRQAEL